MLNIFESHFKKTQSIANHGIFEKLYNSELTILNNYGGNTYDHGLYRIHTINSSSKWNQIVSKSFPHFNNLISCFGFDWCGRQYALDTKSYNKLYMFDCAAFESFELNANIISFHNEILIQNKFDTLLEDEFNEWMGINNRPLNFNECIGFKVPLFLNGIENISNLELVKMDFYWDMTHLLYYGD